MQKQPNSAINTTDPAQINLKRQLNGSTFLSLEHWAYMFLVVLLPIILLAAFNEALGLWANKQPMLIPVVPDIPTGHFGVTMALTYAAALLTLAPLLYVLRRRTNSEFLKRPHYKERLAYKVPIYGALAALAVLKTTAFIAMVAAFLQSLALIGVQGADIGGIYLNQFLPSLLALALFGVTSLYLFKLAKGVDNSRPFAFSVMVLSCVMALALIITATTVSHNQQSNPTIPQTKQNMPAPLYDDLYGR